MPRLARLIAVVALAAVAAEAAALDVSLYDGEHYIGDARLSIDTVFVHAGHTTYEIPRGSVKEVVMTGPEKAECEARRVKLAPTAEAHYEFAKWLDSMLQFAEAEKFYRSAIEFDPDHAQAREALGYKKTDGQWTLSDEDRLRIRSTWLGHDGADASFELAKLFRKSGDERRVAVMLRRALIANPYHADALLMMRPLTDQYVSKNKYRLPFAGACAVINDHNEHHRSAAFMQYGLDFQKVDDKLSAWRVPQPRSVEDVYTWDEPVLAAADGEVQGVVDGMEDLPFGIGGEFWHANMVCLKHAGGEFTVYGHLKKGSIVVKKGQKVKAGDVVGRGGNSGSAGVPHMHWAMYDRDGIGLPATFVDCIELTPQGEKKIDSSRLEENHCYKAAPREKK